ncbi:MAG: hypothetical protein A2X81_12805 [Desulfobacterales bacterium GWB2_56_26]|nr:MAG: hypothetical protein A2X81_12805 [Desulfobacterales bacterium GWB2_56_26]
MYNILSRVFFFVAINSLVLLFGCSTNNKITYSGAELNTLKAENKFDLLIKHYETTTNVPDLQRNDSLSEIFTYQVPDFARAIELNEKILKTTKNGTFYYIKAATRLVFIYSKLGQETEVLRYRKLIDKREDWISEYADKLYQIVKSKTKSDYYAVMATLGEINKFIMLLGIDKHSKLIFEQYLSALKLMMKQRDIGDVDSLILSKYYFAISEFRSNNTLEGLKIASEFLNDAANREVLISQELKKKTEMKSLDTSPSAQSRFNSILGSLEGNTLAALTVFSVAELFTGGSFLIRPLYQEAEIERIKFTSSYAVGISRYLNQTEQIELYLYLAYAYKNGGNTSEAIKALQLVLKTLEAARSTLVYENQRISYFKNLNEVYSELITLLIKNQEYEEAFNASERARSRALLDLLSSKKINLSNEESEIFREVVDYQAELSAVFDSKELTKEAVESFNERHRAVTKRPKKNSNQEVENSLASNKVKHLVSFDTANIAEIQKFLANDAVLVEYYYTSKKLFIFVLSQQGLSVASQDIYQDHFENLVQNYLNSVKNGTQSIATAKQLYDYLLKPIEKNLENKHVVIIPYGALHSLSFAALHDDSTYLIEKFSISYSASGSLLQSPSRKTVKDDNGLVFGDPVSPVEVQAPALPYAREEAVNVSLNRANAKMFLGMKATETRLKELAPTSKWIHIASHAFFDDVDPMKSAIILSADEKNDGFLSANELFVMDLSKTDMLVLSACETGVGKVVKGDEYFGLIRGFQYAGVSAIVSTLWKIEDKTSASLMTQFYNYSNEYGKAKALQLAQKKFTSTSPFYWGAYKLIGDWR